MLSRLDSARRTDGRTDGQIDRIAISISRVSRPIDVLMRDKNLWAESTGQQDIGLLEGREDRREFWPSVDDNSRGFGHGEHDLRPLSASLDAKILGAPLVTRLCLHRVNNTATPCICVCCICCHSKQDITLTASNVVE